MNPIRRLQSFLLENRGVTQTIAKNAAWLFGGQAASRLLRAAIVIYAARVLGVSSWGAFSYALGVATFLTVFSDIGIGALLTREGTQSPERRNRYLATAFITKLILLAAIALLVILFFPYLTKIEEAARIMPILIFVFLFDTLRDLGSAFSRALERMEIEATFQTAANLAIVAFSFIFLSVYGTSDALAAGYAVGSGLGFLGITFALRRHLHGIFAHFDRKLIGEILKTAWPFGLFGVMGIAMLNTDIIMLGWLRTPEEVGEYAAAQKLIQVLYAIPAIFAASLFPTLTKLVRSDPVEARRLLERSVALAILAAIPIAAVGVLVAPLLVPLLFGAAYAPGILSLQILMATALIIFPSAIVGVSLFAYGGERRMPFFVAVAVLGNIVLNAIFIPPYGIEGAAVATIIVQLVVNGLIWRTTRRINNFAVIPELKRNLVRLTRR